jgi:quercetin dioxygenase-like cupin family protein
VSESAASEGNRPPHRVVIGQDAQGRSAAIFDSAPLPVVANKTYPGVFSGSLWKEGATIDISSREDGLDTFSDVSVPVGGTRFFWNEIGPGVRTAMHTTATIEYHRVISGRIVIELEGDDIEVAAGDTIVMRGVPHGWYNPSETEPWVSFAVQVDMSTSFE